MDSDNFFIQPSQKDGFSDRCKPCQKIFNHNGYMKKQKVNIERARKRALDNHEEYKEYLKQWKKDNPNYMPEYNKRYYAENTEKFYEKLSKWEKENPDRLAQYRLRKRKHTISKQEWINCKNYFDNCCAYCGMPVEEHIWRYKDEFKQQDLHKEHLDDEGNNTLDNCVPSCKSCNSEKSSYDFDVWYSEDNPKWSQDRYDKIIKWITEDYKQYIEPLQPKRKYKKRNSKASI
jgi:hypothetical protein